MLNGWHTRLSVALQKGNAACLLQAGRVRGAADLQGETGWAEDLEDLVEEAAAGAGLGVPREEGDFRRLRVARLS